MEGRWCSAAEVAADVSRAGGGVAPPAPRAIAGACLAWGARPAPLILTEAEGQGLGQDERPAPERDATPPDLRGITRMLRMVQPDASDEESFAPYGGGGIAISRLERPRGSPGAAPQHADGNDRTADNTSNLNPNVAEFVPRSVSPAREPPSHASDGPGGRSAQEREQLAVRLREDISEGRNKCSAIARLMRLYAEPAPAPRLLTPDYFERPPAPERAAVHGGEGKSSLTTECESVGGQHMLPEIRSGQPEAGAGALEVRASVDKVRRWLGSGSDEPAAPRASPRLLLAPVTFRSRTPASPAVRTPPPRPARGTAARAYSPPACATATLQREYATRAAAAQAAQAAPATQPAAEDTLWTRLEAQLRKKDAEKRARAAAADS